MNRFLFLLLALVLTLALPVGCGKKASPIPQDAKNVFTWKGSKATRATVMQNGTPQNCINILADMTGAVHNVESFLIELEPQSGEICRECPFTPSEASQIKPTNTQTYEATTRFTFNYCPTREAESYRMRLVATNLFAAFPYEMTKIQTVGR